MDDLDTAATVDPVVTATTNITPDSLVVAQTDRLAKPWSISEDLLPFLGTWENGVANGKNFAHQMVEDGFILKVYKDSRKLPTIGCGHLVTKADKLTVGKEISMDKAKELLKRDIAVAENAINTRVNVPLYQYEYDALVSIAFNAGAAGVSKLCKSVNEGRYEDIPTSIETYRTGGGNEKRRGSEAQLFKSGIYDASH